MRVLWLSHLIPYPPKGGVLQRSYHMIREVSRYHELSVLAFCQPRLIAPLYPSLEEGLVDSARAMNELCKKYACLPIPSEFKKWGTHILAFKSLFTQETYNVNWLKSKEMRSVFGEWLRDGDYDLVHYDTLGLASYFDESRNIPSILDHHNIESHMLRRRCTNEKNVFKRGYFLQESRRLAQYERHWCPRFDLNVTCSDADSMRLSELAPSANIRTLENGVDVKYFVPVLQNIESNRLVFVGRMSFYPNIQAMEFMLDKVWPLLKQRCPDITLDIIGANPPASIVNRGRALVGVKVHGFVDDVRTFINRAAVYVCPVMDGGGTKLKILDALASGKAIVAHPIACEGIAVTNHQHVILARYPEEFAVSISTLLADEVQREKLGRAARELAVERYSYEKIGRRFASMIEDVGTQRSRARRV